MTEIHHCKACNFPGRPFLVEIGEFAHEALLQSLKNACFVIIMQKLVSANIVSVGGMLHMEEDEIADILESAGYTTYKHR